MKNLGNLWYPCAKALASAHPALNVWSLPLDCFYQVAKQTGLGYLEDSEAMNAVVAYCKAYRENKHD